MAKSTFFQSSFVSGELSPLLKGRVDLGQYYQGVQKGEDVLIVPQGGLKRRPGSEVVAEAVNTITRYTTVPTMPNGGTAANINDNNPATNATTNAIGTKGTPAGSPSAFVVAKYDLLSATADVFFVDIEPENDQLLADMVKKHPKIKRAGDGPSVPQWFIQMQDSFKTFTKIMP